MLTRKSFVVLLVMFTALTVMSINSHSVDARPFSQATEFSGSSSDSILTVKNASGGRAGGYAISAENASMNTWRPAILGTNTGASAGVFGSSDGWHAVVGYKGRNDNRELAGVWGHNSGLGMGVYGDSDGGVGVKGVAKGSGSGGDGDADTIEPIYETHTIGVWGVAASDNSLAGLFEGDVSVYGELRATELRGSLDYTTEYIWRQGMQPIRLIDKSSGFCFLTFVSGEFEGGGEWVHVRINEQGYWELTGNSYKEGVQARARCIRFW